MEVSEEERTKFRRGGQGGKRQPMNKSQMNNTVRTNEDINLPDISKAHISFDHTKSHLNDSNQEILAYSG